ncbi:MAG: sodium-dependent transporter [Rikenellaceae bacterium]
MNKDFRGQFGSKIGAVLVAAGSSVGLGNIWRFPYVMGESGGAAFLLIYICCILLIGLPIMLGEFAVGRATGKNAVGAYRDLDRRWTPLGYCGMLASFFIMGFYFVVASWTANYFACSVTGELAEYSTAAEYHSLFKEFVNSPWKLIGYTWLFISATHLVIYMGVNRGIERISKILMPMLFVILIIMAIRSLTLPNSREGLEFMFHPDFSKITADVVIQALGQAFFSLSVASGCLITYASYFNRKTNLRNTAIQVTILDTVVALLSGIIIFPACFSVGVEVGSGEGLVFVTLPSIFNEMAGGMVWSSAFFLLLVIAALTSTIAQHEVATSYLIDEWKLSRAKATIVTTIAVGLLATVAALSLSVWSGYKLFDLRIFDLLDQFTANLLIPLGGFFTTIFVGWRMDRKLLRNQLTNGGEQNLNFERCVVFLLKYVCPVIMMIIFLDSIGVV